MFILYSSISQVLFGKNIMQFAQATLIYTATFLSLAIGLYLKKTLGYAIKLSSKNFEANFIQY